MPTGNLSLLCETLPILQLLHETGLDDLSVHTAVVIPNNVAIHEARGIFPSQAKQVSHHAPQT